MLAETARHSAIYALGVILNRAAGFLMLPLYTRYLTPTDYGAVEMLFMTTEVFAMVASAGLYSAVFRFHASAADEDGRRTVIATSTFLFIGFYAIAALIGAACAGPLAAALLPGVSDGETLFRLIFLSFFLQSFIEIPSLYLRVLGLPGRFVAIGCAKLVLQIGLNVIFLVAMDLRVLGVLYSTLLSSLAVGAVTLPWALRRTGLCWNNIQARLLLVFGAPLIFASLGNFVLTFGERYFLTTLSGLNETGIYALGYKLGMVLWVFAVTPIFTSWEAQRFEVAKRADAALIESRTFFWMNLGVIACGLGLALFARDFFRIMSAPEFWRAHEIVPLIVLAYLFQAWTQFGNFGLLQSGRTRTLAQATAVAAITMGLACLWLVPLFGAMGAALATLIAYAVRFACVVLPAQRSYRMQLPWARVLLALLMAGATWSLARLLPNTGLLESLLLNGAAFMLFLIALVVGPVLTQAERTELGDVTYWLVSRIKLANPLSFSRG